MSDPPAVLRATDNTSLRGNNVHLRKHVHRASWHDGAMDIAGWEDMYRSGERGSEDAPTILVVEISEKLAPGTAIDLACGTGRNALYLAERGWAVAAVDGSEKAVELLRLRSTARGFTWPTFVGI